MEPSRWTPSPDASELGARLRAARAHAALLTKTNVRLKVDALAASAATEATVLLIGVERHLRMDRPAGPGHGAADGSSRLRSR